jgi:hypothetical protein
MRRMQPEFSFDDSSSSSERATLRTIESLGHMEDLSFHNPLPRSRRHAFKVICLECSQRFTTTSSIPTCPGCGGSDVELQ